MTEPAIDACSPGGPVRRREAILVSVLLLVTACVYLPSLSDDFVFDDFRFVPENEAIRDLGNVVGFFTDLSTLSGDLWVNVGEWGDIYRPLRTLSYAIDYRLFGPSAFWFRLENLLWHLTAVFLAWLLLRRLAPRPNVAVLGAGIFALHPLQTQAVAWISSRGDLMSAVALLAASLMLLRDDRRVGPTIAGCGLYAVALLSKESGIALLALVPLHDVLFPPRPRFRPGLLAVLAGITVVFLIVRFSMASGQVPLSATTLLGSGSATLVLVAHTLLPVRLLPYTGDILSPDRLGTAPGAAVLLAVAGLVVLALLRGRRHTSLAFGFLWAVVCLAPVSGLVPLKSLAESRFAYVALVGVGLVSCVLVNRLGRPGHVAAYAVLALFSLLTVKEARVWRNDLALWGSAVEKATEYRIPRPGQKPITGGYSMGNYGGALLKLGRSEEALEVLEEASRIHSGSITWHLLAIANKDLGRREQALGAARRAYDIDPDDRGLRELCGELLYVLGHADDAVDVLADGLRIEPDRATLRAWYAAALLDVGRLGEARRQFEGTLERTPEDDWVLYMLGVTCLTQGDHDAARRTFDRTLELHPDHFLAKAGGIGARMMGGEEAGPGERRILVQAAEILEAEKDHVGVVQLLRALWPLNDIRLQAKMVVALRSLGRYPETESRLLDMLERWPDDVWIAGNLGLFLLDRGRAEEALPHLDRAVAGDPESFVLRLAVVRAYRDLGRRQEAEAAAREAMARARSDRERDRVREVLPGR